MEDLIVIILIGTLLIIMGIMNIKGNISTLHRYHRKRVAPEDIKPFGRLCGIGSIVAGAGLVFKGVFSFVSQSTCNHTLDTIGTVFLIASLAIGIGLMLFAIIKYNKGIF